jgi:hypothetical protein
MAKECSMATSTALPGGWFFGKAVVVQVEGERDVVLRDILACCGPCRFNISNVLKELCPKLNVVLLVP